MSGLPPYQFLPPGMPPGLPPGHPAWQAMMAQQQAQQQAQLAAQVWEEVYHRGFYFSCKIFTLHFFENQIFSSLLGI